MIILMSIIYIIQYDSYDSFLSYHIFSQYAVESSSPPNNTAIQIYKVIITFINREALWLRHNVFRNYRHSVTITALVHRYTAMSASPSSQVGIKSTRTRFPIQVVSLAKMTEDLLYRSCAKNGRPSGTNGDGRLWSINRTTYVIMYIDHDRFIDHDGFSLLLLERRRRMEKW